MIGIYKIVSPTGRVYIGQSWDVERRWYAHTLINNAKCRQAIIVSSMLKYGPDAHEFKMIHELPNDIDQSVMDGYEQFYIDQYAECGCNLMNVRGAGSHGKFNEEAKKKMSESAKKAFTPERRKAMSDAMILKCKENRIAHTGKKMPDATKQKLREANIGRKPTSNKLNEDQVREIKCILNVGVISMYRVAKMYNVHKVTIFDIKHNKTWKNVL